MPIRVRSRKAIIERFFDENPVPTVSGLGLALGMTRPELVGYDGPDRYIRRAMVRIEEFLETRAYGPNSTGFVFGLKNNFGWQDRPELRAKATAPTWQGKAPQDMTDEELLASLMQDYAGKA